MEQFKVELDRVVNEAGYLSHYRITGTPEYVGGLTIGMFQMILYKPVFLTMSVEYKEPETGNVELMLMITHN